MPKEETLQIVISLPLLPEISPESTDNFSVHVLCVFWEVELRGCDACQGIWIRWSGTAGALLAWFQGLIQVRLSTMLKGCSQSKQLVQ